jgi:phospholipid transport system transporter-binding protein
MIDADASASDQVRLSGDLTVDEVPAMYLRSKRWLAAGLPRRIDLSALEATDSSAIALLLEWAEWARTRGQEIEFLDPPEGLRTIAGLSQVGPLLGWETP